MQSTHHTTLPLAALFLEEYFSRALLALFASSPSRHMHNLVVLTSSLLVLRDKLRLYTPRCGETRDIRIARTYT